MAVSSSEHDEAKKELESYLNKRMRIRISDGRVIDGIFLCTDRDCNIVLGNCEEFFSQDEVGMKMYQVEHYTELGLWSMGEYIALS